MLVLRWSKVEFWSIMLVLRWNKVELRSIMLVLRWSKVEFRSIMLVLRWSKVELRSIMLVLRWSKMELRSIMLSIMWNKLNALNNFFYILFSTDCTSSLNIFITAGQRSRNKINVSRPKVEGRVYLLKLFGDFNKIKLFSFRFLLTYFMQIICKNFFAKLCNSFPNRTISPFT